MAIITGIRDTCTVKVDKEWRWSKYSGKEVRIVGLVPPNERKDFPDIVKQMEDSLCGRIIKLISPHFIETGPCLVSEVAIEGIALAEMFCDRFMPTPPRPRMMDPSDVRRIRRVNGRIESEWHNPMRDIPKASGPSLGNLPFPVDRWVPGADEALAQVQAVFCHDRKQMKRDETALRTFLKDRTERTLILFGDCGCGKSWFVRQYLVENPPDKMDVGIIDVSDFQQGEHFSTRLHLRLDEILGEYVNKRSGGLRVALSAYLERRTQGIFPNCGFRDPVVEKWCEHHLGELSQPNNLVTFNTIRLASYAYSERDLLLVIDNIDRFSPEDQGTVFDLVVQAVTMHSGVFSIIPLRPSSEFFYARLNTKLQHLLRGVRLSHISEVPMIKKRMTTSQEGADISKLLVHDRGSKKHSWSMVDILNRYIGGDSVKIIANIAQGDVRQYIRLFRRLLYSDEINGFDKIANDYYCVGALMLKPGEPFTEDSSFVLNVFDNDHPDEIGNALIRWRVLEYFLKGNRQCEGEFFLYYFRRLGYDLRRVREVIYSWAQAGALEIFEHRAGLEAHPTGCARQYETLISSLWYCIAIKTGMNIDSNYILEGEEAKKAASDYGFSLPKDTEWVSDDGFLEFLADEEKLEEERIQSFPSKSPLLEEKCRTFGPESIHRKLWYEYTYQRRSWELARGKRRGTGHTAIT